MGYAVDPLQSFPRAYLNRGSVDCQRWILDLTPKSRTKRDSYRDDVGLLLCAAVRLLASQLGDPVRSS